MISLSLTVLDITLILLHWNWVLKLFQLFLMFYNTYFNATWFFSLWRSINRM